jgi:hypothetical protein
MNNILKSLKSVNNIIKPFNYIFTTLFIIIITIDSIPDFNELIVDLRFKIRNNWKIIRENHYSGLLLFYIPFMYFYINKDIMNMLLLFISFLVLDLS